MTAVVNATAGRELAVPMKDRDGRSLMVVLLKYTFSVDRWGQVTAVVDGRPAPYPADLCRGEDPATSTITRPSDLAPSKPGTDVILVGHAHAPHGQATYVDVRLRVGGPSRPIIDKTVRAHGLRAFQRATFGGLSAGPARPLREPVPLVWELAYGGFDDSDPSKIVAEPRNYLGRGVARDLAKLVDTPAPQLEDPAHPLGSRSVVPACFAPIHRHWQPRASYAGTYDDRWMESRMPLLPTDFDDRYHVTVTPDQWSSAPLRGDEPIEVSGATEEGSWQFQLPRLAPGFSSMRDGVTTAHRTHLDTLLLDADLGRVELTYRAAIPIPPKLELLRQIAITEKAVLGS